MDILVGQVGDIRFYVARTELIRAISSIMEAYERLDSMGEEFRLSIPISVYMESGVTTKLQGRLQDMDGGLTWRVHCSFPGVELTHEFVASEL